MIYAKGQLIETELGINESKSHISARYASAYEDGCPTWYWGYSFNTGRQFVFEIQEVFQNSVKVIIPVNRISLNELKIDGYGTIENCYVYLNKKHITLFRGKLCIKCGFSCVQGCITGDFKVL